MKGRKKKKTQDDNTVNTLTTLGERRPYWDNMGVEELIAFEVVLGLSQPRDIYTKQWAIKTMKTLLEARLVAASVHQAFETQDFDDIFRLMDYYVGKAKTVVEASGPEGGDIPVALRNVPQEVVVAALLKESGRPGQQDRQLAMQNEENGS
jgi:hypothetical protein